MASDTAVLAITDCIAETRRMSIAYRVHSRTLSRAENEDIQEVLRMLTHQKLALVIVIEKLIVYLLLHQ